MLPAFDGGDDFVWVGHSNQRLWRLEGAGIWTGGAGECRSVRGFQRNHGLFDLDKGLNQRAAKAGGRAIPRRHIAGLGTPERISTARIPLSNVIAALNWTSLRGKPATIRSHPVPALT